MRSPKHRRGTPMDRVLAMAFVACFLYLVYLAMTGRADDLVRDLATWLARSFG